MKNYRSNPANPDTANCAFWLSDEQEKESRLRHIQRGHTLVGEHLCPCGNHTRREWL